jgi:hypothetical protein
MRNRSNSHRKQNSSSSHTGKHKRIPDYLQMMVGEGEGVFIWGITLKKKR